MRTMKMLFALVLLFLQLQPVAGAAVCAYDMGGEMAAESSMTDHSRMPAAPADCPLVALCTVTAPATVPAGPELDIATCPPSLVGYQAPEAGPASGVAAPPFHPPIV